MAAGRLIQALVLGFVFVSATLLRSSGLDRSNVPSLGEATRWPHRYWCSRSKNPGNGKRGPVAVLEHAGLAPRPFWTGWRPFLIGLPGPIEKPANFDTVPVLQTVQSWQGFPFLERLSTRFGVPIFARSGVQTMNHGRSQGGRRSWAERYHLWHASGIGRRGHRSAVHRVRAWSE